MVEPRGGFLQQSNLFLILDFGSQYTQLIARRLRELGFYSQIERWDLLSEEIRRRKPKGIVLSGGPNSIYDSGSPKRSVKELMEIAPVLGICYGMQMLVTEFGGRVEGSGGGREYGLTELTWQKSWSAGIPTKMKVWASHGDHVTQVPVGFEVLAQSEAAPNVIQAPRVLALQFHPEVAHTQYGNLILKEFCTGVCGATPDWNPGARLALLTAEIRKQVGESEQVLVGLSGGVDSSVLAVLLTQALGAQRVHCVFINNGLLRHLEFERVQASLKGLGLNLRAVDATSQFLSELKGVVDPEKKRKIIGRVFVEVFDSVVNRDLPKVQWLAQGTLYPDVIESVAPGGGISVTIKSHHNVGGLPEKMKLRLLEPFRELFKDEVRELGRELRVPDELLGRHPFPGPGLAVRIIGPVSEEGLRILRAADEIFIQSLRDENLYHRIWQAFCVLLPVQTVGVQGDGRTYDQVLALRAVTSQDGMTADWFSFEPDFLRRVSNAITNKVRGVSRVVYDISSKPPATIEWE